MSENSKIDQDKAFTAELSRIYACLLDRDDSTLTHLAWQLVTSPSGPHFLVSLVLDILLSYWLDQRQIPVKTGEALLRALYCTQNDVGLCAQQEGLIAGLLVSVVGCNPSDIEYSGNKAIRSDGIDYLVLSRARLLQPVPDLPHPIVETIARDCCHAAMTGDLCLVLRAAGLLRDATVSNPPDEGSPLLLFLRDVERILLPQCRLIRDNRIAWELHLYDHAARPNDSAGTPPAYVPTVYRCEPADHIPVVPDEVKVVAALRRGLDWLAVNRSQFSPRLYSTQQELLQLLKPYSEFILTVDVLLSLDCPDPRLREHLNWAWREIDIDDFLFRLLVARPDLCQLATIPSYFVRWGYGSERLVRLIKTIAQMRATVHVDINLWVKTSLACAFQRLGLSEYPVPPGSYGWTHNRPEPWMLTEENAYVLTHEIYFATEFGARPSVIPTAVRDYLQLWLPVWLRYYNGRENWDLVAELLITVEFLQLDDAAHPWLAALMNAQRPDGFVNSAEGSFMRLLRADQTDERQRFLKNYHSTLVAILAISAYAKNRGLFRLMV